MSYALAGSRLAHTARCTLEASREARWFPVTPGARTRAQARALQRTCVQLVSGFGLDIRTIGPRPSGRVVLVSNHLSYIDPIVLATVMPCTVIAKSSVERWPLIGPRMRELGVVFVDREDGLSPARALRQARRALLEGVSVLNFPEGTTTDGTRLLPFARGMFGVARLAQVPVVPIGLRLGHAELTWTGGETFLPHYARTAARPSLSALLRIGAPLHPAHFPSAAAFAAVARREVARLLEDPRDDHHALAIPRDAGLRRVVPAPRPDPVLPAADGVLRRATA